MPQKLKQENLDLKVKIAQFESLNSADLFAELKEKNMELEALRTCITEFENEKKCHELEIEEKDGQISRLFEENLLLQKCKEKANKVLKLNDALTTQTLELIRKNKELSNEIKDIRKILVNYQEKMQKINSDEKLLKKSQENNENSLLQNQYLSMEISMKLSENEQTIEKLKTENSLLKSAIEKEQKERIKKIKDITVLEGKLRKAEKEIKKSEDTRYKLSVDIQTLQGNIQKLTQKIVENESLVQMCNEFLQNNNNLSVENIAEIRK